MTRVKYVGKVAAIAVLYILAARGGLQLDAVSGFATLVWPPTATRSAAFAQAYVFFPIMIWAAIRFGQCGAVSTTFVVSAIAVWGTAMGQGPFVQSTLHGSLFALQNFMGVTAATFLVLGASTAERERSLLSGFA